MCRFARGLNSQGDELPNFTKICDGEGNMLACKLCPESITYWQLTAPDPSPTPWNGNGERTIPDQDRTDRFPGAIDGREVIEIQTPTGKVKRAWSMTPPNQAAPCTLCLRKTCMRSPKGVAVHKACAEQWRNGRRAFAQPR